jgi:hypothetical protein
MITSKKRWFLFFRGFPEENRIPKSKNGRLNSKGGNEFKHPIFLQLPS